MESPSYRRSDGPLSFPMPAGLCFAVQPFLRAIWNGWGVSCGVWTGCGCVVQEGQAWDADRTMLLEPRLAPSPLAASLYTLRAKRTALQRSHSQRSLAVPTFLQRGKVGAMYRYTVSSFRPASAPSLAYLYMSPWKHLSRSFFRSATLQSRCKRLSLEMGSSGG